MKQFFRPFSKWYLLMIQFTSATHIAVVGDENDVQPFSTYF